MAGRIIGLVHLGAALLLLAGLVTPAWRAHRDPCEVRRDLEPSTFRQGILWVTVCRPEAGRSACEHRPLHRDLRGPAPDWKPFAEGLATALLGVTLIALTLRRGVRLLRRPAAPQPEGAAPPPGGVSASGLQVVLALLLLGAATLYANTQTAWGVVSSCGAEVKPGASYLVTLLGAALAIGCGVAPTRGPLARDRAPRA